ncbi:MAG: DUF2188 domain-containing protein [Ignavibacteriae bacterium]|nr:MAG: DUF2188 domain-containing protein [Ignavibacteriota bacterium]
MANKKVWVSPSGNDWKVTKEGNSRASVITDTKKEAIEKAIPIAKKEHSEVIIQKKNGQIQDRDSYGNESKAKDTKH